MPTRPDSRVQYMARQPILDNEEQTAGYELLYRAAPESFARFSDNNAASRDVLEQVVMLGCRELSAGKRLFMNCTSELLTHEYITVLPAESVVVEILETVEPTSEVLEACRRLKKAGFTIALDDFAPGPMTLPLLPFADIIKVDFRTTTERTRQEILEKHCKGIQALAEKVETRAEYKSARNAGFELFQGYFFCEPLLLANLQLLPLRLNHLRLLEQTCRPELDFVHVEQVIKTDPALCYRLLRYLNSCAFCLRTRITSIRHAITLLGEDQVRKWVAVACVSAAADGSSPSSLSSALLRARFGELLAPKTGCRPYDMFIVGLFSLMNTFLGIPLERLLTQVRVPPESASALLGEQNRLRKVFDLVVAYERGDWEDVWAACSHLHLEAFDVTSDYRAAVQWVDNIAAMNAEAPAPQVEIHLPTTAPGNGLRPM